MEPREALVLATMSPARRKALEKERQQFADFRAGFDLDESPEAVILYLTYLAHTLDLPGGTVRRRLALLNVSARVSGRPDLYSEPDVRTFLRGLHRERPIGASAELSPPVYRETLRAMVDAIMLPSHDQLRDRAVLLFANHTLWPAVSIARLRWHHVHFHRDRVDIDYPPGKRLLRKYPARIIIPVRHDDLCVVAALRRIQPSRPAQDQQVFASRLGACDRGAVEATIIRLPRREHRPYPIRFRTGGAPLRRILADATAPWPLQLRDRALLLIGYGAALRDFQAMHLLQRHVTITPAGLVLDVPGRDQLTAIPSASQTAYCATSAWCEWISLLNARGLQAEELPAFLAGNYQVLWPTPVNKELLNIVVARATEVAQLQDHYTFTGLRIGFIRTAVRGGAPNHTVAAFAGYRRFQSMLRHAQREQLIRTSVAGQLGL